MVSISITAQVTEIRFHLFNVVCRRTWRKRDLISCVNERICIRLAELQKSSKRALVLQHPVCLYGLL